MNLSRRSEIMTLSEMPLSLRKFIADEIANALERHRLPCDSPLREVLKASTPVGDGRNPEVFIRDGSNQLVSIDRRLRQLRNEQRFQGYFPPEPPKVPWNDLKKLSEHFDQIRTGEMSVE
jgi:hypothetical protein